MSAKQFRTPKPLVTPEQKAFPLTYAAGVPIEYHCVYGMSLSTGYDWYVKAEDLEKYLKQLASSPKKKGDENGQE